MNANTIALVEPYYAGSHKLLIDLLNAALSIGHDNSDGELEKVDESTNIHLATMRGKKWHWRARTSALHFAQTLPKDLNYKTIFASCVLPLHELLALRPELHKAKKILYFHENQLIYPIQKTKERDFQYGYNQVLSCLAADVVLFNSEFNKESFLSSIKPFFKLQPDYRPKQLREEIEPKCKVFYFPINFAAIPSEKLLTSPQKSTDTLRILWPHRWEFDKNPDMFFAVIFRLVQEEFTNFRLSILGENFTDNPPIFSKARSDLDAYIDHFGYLESKEEYFQVLWNSDIVISTANHEFFGVAMLESTYCGCYPLCPNSLVYPEIFSASPNSLYLDEEDLYSKLKMMLQNPGYFHSNLKCTLKNIDYTKYDWKNLKYLYINEIK